MTELDIAKEKLLAAACGYVSSRLHRDCSEPSPYDDAQEEFHLEILDQAAVSYATLLESR